MRWSLLVAASSLCGCLTSEVEPQLTITQGLYGQLTEACEGAGCLGTPRVGAPVAWFDVSPAARQADGGYPEPVKELRSQANGFYELDLEPAAKGYVAVGFVRADGVRWFTSKPASVPRGLGRVDWRAGPDEEGTWTDVK